MTAQGDLTLEPGEIDFGEVPSGATGSRSLTAENTGRAPLTLLRVEVLDATGPAFSIEDEFPVKLSPGEQRVLNVHFAAGALPLGPQSALLRLQLDDPAATVAQVPLRARVASSTVITDGGVHPLDYWIAFDSNRAAGNRDLYAVRPDGTDLRRLTDDEWTEMEPAFSPDGTRIAFASDRVDFTLQIFVMELQTRAVTQVTGGRLSASQPSWSPDGTRLAFHRGIGIYTIGVDGQDEQHVADGINELNACAHPHYLPGGGSLVMSQVNRIELVRTDGTDRRIIVEPAATEIETPSPSPSGATIAFAAYCVDGFSIRTASTGMQTSPCTRDAETYFPGTRPAWGPGLIAFETDEANRDIQVVEPTGGPARNLTAHPADDRNAAWSPRGTVLP